MKINSRLLILCACTLSTMQAKALPNSCGAADARFEVTTHLAVPSDPAPGRGEIIFLQTVDAQGMFVGAQVQARIGVDGAWAGAAVGNSYVAYTLTPGPHHVCVN